MNQELPGGLEDDAIEFGEIGASLGLLLRLAQVRVFNAFFQSLARYGLKPGEFTLLWLIGMNSGVRQGALARRLLIKPAHMTKLVQRAVDAGHIEREIPPDDRRSVRLSLTSAGERFVAEKKPEFLNFIAKEKTHLSDAEFAQLIRLLRKFNGMERP